MNIQDSSPERRNLLALSCCMIVFFLGGGSFPDKTLKLQVISVEFYKPEMLNIILWLSLFWFLYRYWLLHRNAFKEEFSREFNELRTKDFFRNYIEESFDSKLAPDIAAPSVNETGLVVEWLRLKKWQIICLVWEKNIGRDELGNIKQQGPCEGGIKETFTPSDNKAIFIATKLILTCLIQKPSFSTFLIPYYLAFFAIGLGLCHTL